jgi:hypothetical protein
MAVTRKNRPYLDGLRPARGALRIVAWRWVFALITSLPAALTAFGYLSSDAGRRPYYTSVQGPLPVFHLLRFMESLPDSFLPAALISVMLAVIADQLLTAGALALLDPGRPEGDRRGALAVIAHEGGAHLGAFARITLYGLALFGLGVLVVSRVSGRISLANDRVGATMLTTVVIVPLVMATLLLFWFAIVGAWVLWCRVLTVADGRRRVRRTGLLVLGVWRRRIVRALLLPTLLTLAAALLPGIIPIAWRMAAPATRGAVFGWFAAWLLALFAQAFVWQWVIRATRLMYSAPELDPLRESPDAPLGLIARVHGLFRRERRQRPAPSASPP